jgi:(E)-4-hydroxy-3-methylbut-2-enyl-diphosphate synthase
MIKRRKSKVVEVAGVKIGGANPIVIQGMAKEDTEDVRATINEIKNLEKAGCELVRLAIKTEKAASNIREIKNRTSIPLIADIHFDYRLALCAIDNGIDKVRINPGNISKPKHLQEIIKRAKKAKIPIRIGLNSGSLPAKCTSKTLPVKMASLALKIIRLFEKSNFYDIVVSLKSSDVLSTIKANELIAGKTKYPLHLGVTATGTSTDAIIKSTLGIGTLLKEGLGDTVRVSLTSSSEKEIEVAQSILQALNLRRFKPDIISCPACGRCQINLQKETQQIKKILEKKAERNNNLLSLKVAVMGCEVNGPGEAKAADIGLAFGKNYAALFKKGKIVKRVKAKDAKGELLREIDNEMV